jgi:hypothetical protein
VTTLVEADEGESAAAPTAAPDVGRRLFIVSCGVAIFSIVFALANAIHRGWVPIGDDAIFAIRARDVFSAHPPLLGTWTSASLTTKIDINNPGPLLYDALALPTTLFGSAGIGVAIGAAAINIACALGFGVIAYRRGGAAIGSIAMAIVAVLAWTMGSAALVDPVQTTSLLFPFLLLIALIWAASCDELWSWPWIVGVGSLVAQTYVTYAYFIPILMVWAAVAVVLRFRAVRRADPDAWHALSARARRSGIIAAVVLVLCWAQPLWEQLTGRGAGNISRLVRSVRAAPPTFGPSSGTRVVAQVITRPPWWFRPSFRQFLASGPKHTVSLAFAAVTLLVLLAVMAWLARVTIRRGDRDFGYALVTAIVAVLAALFTAARVPTGGLAITQHTFRWLWPIAAFMWFAIISVLVRRYLTTRTQVQWVSATCIALAGVVGLLNLPWTDQGATAQQADIPVAHDLGRQLAHARIPGPVLVDLRGEKFADPFGTAVLVQLQRHGVRFVTPDPGLLYQLGYFRHYDGTNARAGIVLREGDDVHSAPAGSQLLAQHLGLDTKERAELDALVTQLTAYIDVRGLQLNERGAAAVRHGDLVPFTADQVQDPASLFGSRVLVPFALGGDLQVDSNTAKQFARYAELQRRWDEQTVAVYLTPVSAVSGGA